MKTTIHRPNHVYEPGELPALNENHVLPCILCKNDRRYVVSDAADHADCGQIVCLRCGRRDDWVLGHALYQADLEEIDRRGGNY